MFEELKNHTFKKIYLNFLEIKNSNITPSLKYSQRIKKIYYL